MTFVAFLYSITFIMSLVAVKGRNQNCAVSIQNEAVISEYQSAVLAKKNIDAVEGGIISTDRFLHTLGGY